jgi:hypothetical protein
VTGIPLGLLETGRATRGAEEAGAGEATAKVDVLVVELGRRLEEVLRKW